MFKRIASLILFVFMVFSGIAIEKIEGSVKELQEFISASSDHEAIARANYSIAVLLRKINTDEALTYIDKSTEYFREKNLSKDYIQSLILKGSILKLLSEYEKASYTLNEALNEAKNNSDEELLAKIYNNLGNVYLRWDKKGDARRIYTKALNLKEKQGDQLAIATTLVNIANLDSKLKDYDLAIEGYLKALKIRQDSNNFEGIANIYQNLGEFYMDQGDYAKTVDYIEKSIAINHNSDIRIKQLINNYLSLGVAYRNIAIPDGIIESPQYFYKSDSIYRIAINKSLELNDQYNIALAYTEIGELLVFSDSIDESYQFLMKALNISNELNSDKLKYYSNLALYENFYYRNDFKTSLFYIDEAMFIAKKINNKEYLRDTYEAYYKLFEKYEQKNKAFEYFKKHIKIKEEIQDLERSQKVIATSARHDYEQVKNDLIKAQMDRKIEQQRSYYIMYLLVGGIVAVLIVVYVLFRSMKLKQKAFDIVKMQKFEVEKQRDKVKQKSLELEKSYDTISNLNIIGKEIISSLNLREVNAIVYKHLKQLIDINVFGIYLYQPNKKKLLGIGMMENDKAIENHEVDVNRESYVGICFEEGIDIILKDNFVEYSKYIQKRNIIKGDGMRSIIYLPLVHKGNNLGAITVQNKEENAFTEYHINIIRNIANFSAIAIDNANAYAKLNMQKDKIAKHSKEVQESILYAQNIQNSLLPSKTYLDSIIDDYFVLYQPCQIVSGDFYWAHELEDGRKMLMVADCTGHGVPGAMLSMISISHLNEIVINYGISDPGEILNNLRMRIKESMRTAELQRDDSLDATLICIDKYSKKITYSGAFNKLIQVTGLDEVISHDVDRQPIGNYPIMEDFTTSEIVYKEGDVFYLFTDGFQDQIGGEKVKKYGMKRMKSLFGDMYTKPMSYQNRTMSSIIRDWEKNLFQLDDRCVIGIRL